MLRSTMQRVTCLLGLLGLLELQILLLDGLLQILLQQYFGT